MSTTQDNFTLFTQSECRKWIEELSVSREITKIQIHHTQEPSYEDFKGNDHFTWLKDMRTFHMKQRGFNDIAQHFTVFPDGKIGTGRPLDHDPAGIKGANKGAITIENFGDFDIGKDHMRNEQTGSIVHLVAALARKFHVAVDTEGIIYHHWFDRDTGERTNGTGNTKTCPGTNFFGGNSIASCAGNFIPMVQGAL